MARLGVGGAGVGVVLVGCLRVPPGLGGGVCVRRRVLQPLAGRGVELGGGCLVFWVGLRFDGGGRLLVGSACTQRAVVEGVVGGGGVLLAGLGVVGARARPSVGLWGRMVAEPWYRSDM